MPRRTRSGEADGTDRISQAGDRRLRTTTVYVTHDQIEAMTPADRIVAMNEGCVQQAGRPIDLYDSPFTDPRLEDALHRPGRCNQA